MFLNPKTLDEFRAHVLLSWLSTFVLNAILLIAISYFAQGFDKFDIEKYLSRQLLDLTLVFAPSMLILVGLWFVPIPAKVALTNGQRVVALALSWFFLAAVTVVSIYSAFTLLNHCTVDEGVKRCKNIYAALNNWQPVIFGPILYIFGSIAGAGSVKVDD